MHCFLAEGLTSGVAHPEPGEDLEVGCFDQETIWRMIDEGEIVDGKSLAALLLWQRRGVA